MGRRKPRLLAEALGQVRGEMTPRSGLAAIQMHWSEMVGEAIAEVAAPVSERDGILRVSCREAVWAEELEMMKPAILERLRERFGEAAPADIRFSSGGSRRAV